MNKKILAIALVLFVAIGGCFAKGVTGIGIFGSYGGSTGSTGGGLGLTIKMASFPVLGLQYNFAGSGSFALSCDYYIVDAKAIGGPVTWFLGVGGFAGMVFGNNGYFDAGLRLPIGIQIWPVSKVEFFLSAVPAVHFLPSPYIWLGGEIGLRYHL